MLTKKINDSWTVNIICNDSYIKSPHFMAIVEFWKNKTKVIEIQLNDLKPVDSEENATVGIIIFVVTMVITTAAGILFFLKNYQNGRGIHLNIYEEYNPGPEVENVGNDGEYESLPAQWIYYRLF